MVNLKTIWQRKMEHDMRSSKMPPYGKKDSIGFWVDDLFPLQAFGAIWWVTFGQKNPQLSRVMVLPIDVTDNANSNGQLSGTWGLCD